MRLLACLALFAVLPDAALASGGLSCSAEDEAARFELQAGVTRGLGGPPFNFRGELEILGGKVADDLRKVTFGETDLPQYWLDGEELRLLAYSEREANALFGSVQLEIRTRLDGEPDEGTFAGSYRLTVSDMGAEGAEAESTEFGGEVSCFVE